MEHFEPTPVSEITAKLLEQAVPDDAQIRKAFDERTKNYPAWAKAAPKHPPKKPKH